MIVQFCEKYMVMIVTAAAGTLGYCLLINVKRNKIVYGCLGGVVSTFLYCACVEAGLTPLLQNLIPAAVVTLYAEVLARVIKAPATVFLIPSIIPLVPGFAFTNGIRDLADGDYISGAVRILDAILVFLCVAIGVGTMFIIYHRVFGGTLL